MRYLVLIIFLAIGLPVAADSSAVVLMYHRFGEEQYPSTNIRQDQFVAQLEVLRNENYTVIPLSKLINALTKGLHLPDRAVVITIDDAYRSIYSVAYPLLQKYDYPFTVFVSTDAVDRNYRSHLSWDQIREMAGNNASFANHGASHESLVIKKDGETNQKRMTRVMADIDKGSQRIAAETTLLSGVFAYPYGEYDSKVAAALRSAGYLAFGQQSGAIGPTSDRRALPRYPMAEAYADINDFRIKAASLPLAVKELSPWDPVVNDKQPELILRLGPSDARLTDLSCFVSGQGRITVHWLEPDKVFRIQPAKPLPTGRRRVNCTAPRNDGRYYWYSHQWIVQAGD